MSLARPRTLLVSLTFAAALATLALACGREPEAATATATAAPPTAADRALAEFEGAYPLEPSPSGTIRSFELVAAPTTHVLGDGARMRSGLARVAASASSGRSTARRSRATPPMPATTPT